VSNLDLETISGHSEKVPWFQISAGPVRRVGEFCTGLAWSLFLVFLMVPPSGHSFLPWLTVPLGALGTFHFLRRAFDSAPRLVVNAEGITDRTSLLGKEISIPWNQVAGVTIGRMNGGVFLQIRDLRALIPKASLGRRIEILFRRLFRKNWVRITPTMLGIRYDELGRRIEFALFESERIELGFTPSGDQSLDSDEDRIESPVLPRTI
jgi:hypothetical protein